MALGAIFESLSAWQRLILLCIILTLIIVIVDKVIYSKTGKHMVAGGPEEPQQWGWWLDQILDS